MVYTEIPFCCVTLSDIVAMVRITSQWGLTLAVEVSDAGYFFFLVGGKLSRQLEILALDLAGDE